MAYVMIVLLTVCALFFAVCYCLLKRSIKAVQKQLDSITEQLEENRIVKLVGTDKQLEGLVLSVNCTLQEIRKKKIQYTERESQFKQQIENISHDLRTPLTSMIGYLKIMDVSGLGKEQQEDLQVVLRKAERLQCLITQFYDFSRLTARDYPLQKETVELTRLLREVLADSYAEFSDKQLELVIELPEEPIQVWGDSNACQRVFQNLLQNAGKYASSSLKIALNKAEGQIIISFQNDTHQLSREDVERLFERFYTKDQARHNGSTGLGLTIAKELVEQMGGSMKAHLLEEKWFRIDIQMKETVGK